VKNRAEICSFDEQFLVAPRRSSSRRVAGATESGVVRAHRERPDNGIESRAEGCAYPRAAGAAYRPDRSGRRSDGVSRASAAR